MSWQEHALPFFWGVSDVFECLWVGRKADTLRAFFRMEVWSLSTTDWSAVMSFFVYFGEKNLVSKM